VGDLVDEDAVEVVGLDPSRMASVKKT